MPQIQESPRFEVRRSKISLGPEGGRWSIQKTAELAKQAANDPYVRAWTVQKLHEASQRGIPVETPEQKASVLLEAVQREFTYVSDPVFTEMMVAPKWMVQGFIPGGDCDDLTSLTAGAFLAALSSAGIRSAVLGQAYDNTKKIQHVLCAVYLGDRWAYADPSSKLPLGQAPAPHTWELVYDPLTPEKPFCDATSCLTEKDHVRPPRYSKSYGEFVGVSGLPTEMPAVEFQIVEPAEGAILKIEEIEHVFEESVNPTHEEFCYSPLFPFRRPCREVDIVSEPVRAPLEVARAAMPYLVPTLGNWPLDLPPVAPQPYLISMPEMAPVPIRRPVMNGKSCDCTTCSGGCSGCGGDRRLLSNPFEDPGWQMRPMARPMLFVEETSEKMLNDAWAGQIANLRDSFLDSLQMLILAYEHLGDLCKKFGEPFPPVVAGQFGPSEQKIIEDAVKFAESAVVVMDQALAGKRQVVFTQQDGEPVLAFKTLATDTFRYIEGKALSTIGLQTFLPQLVQLTPTVGTGILPVLMPFVAAASVSMTVSMIKNTQGTLDFMRNIVDKVTLWLINREARKMLETGKATPEQIRHIQGDVYAGELKIKDKELERQRLDNQRLEQENKNLQSLINKGMIVGGVLAVGALGVWAWKTFGGYVPSRPPSAPTPLPPAPVPAASVPSRQGNLPSEDDAETSLPPTMVSPR